jgi:hypothetical protein
MTETEAVEKADATLKQRSRFAILLRPWIMIPVTVLTVLVAIPLGYRSSRLTSVPPIDDIVDRETEGQIDIEPAENAFTYYERALRDLPAEPERSALWNAVDALPTGGWKAVAPVAEPLLDDCEELLAEWRRGTECEWGVRIQPADMEYIDLPEVQTTRTMAWLAILASARSLHEGDAKESWEWLRSLLRYSRHISASGALLDRTVGHAYFAYAAEELTRWASHPGVTVELLKDALVDLRQINRMLPPLSVNLKTEYLVAMKTLDSPAAVREFFRDSSLPQFKREGLQLEGYLFLNAEPQLSRMLVRHSFANLLSQCDLPRRERTLAGSRFFRPTGTERPPLLDPAILEPAVMASPLGQYFVAKIFYAGSEDRAQARQTILELCLCVELFRRAHGGYPRSLDELVPEFLDEVPLDLFGAPTDRLRLIRRDVEVWTRLPDGKMDTVVRPGIVIYSRGPDGTDNNGPASQVDDVGIKIVIPQPEAKPE